MSKRSIPTIRLAGRESLSWLEQALGLELVAVHPEQPDPSGEDGDASGQDGSFRHAELRFGVDWIMASGGGGILGDRPLGTASIYLVVDDDAEVDEGYRRAIAAGATSVLEPVDQDYGGRSAVVCDPEGNAWSFGSYRPDGA